MSICRTDVMLMTTNFNYKSTMEPQGIAILSGVLKSKGFSTALLEPSVDGLSMEQCFEHILNCNPRILGISLLFDLHIDDVIKLINMAKNAIPDINVFIGGQAVSFKYDTELYLPLLELCDAFLIGESELNLPVYVEKVINGDDRWEVPGIVYKKYNKLVVTEPALRVSNLDDIPWQDRSILKKITEKYPNLKEASVQYGRGCKYACSFCCFDNFRTIQNDKIRLRRRSIDEVFREMEYLFYEFGIRKFNIEDESFLELNDEYKDKMLYFCSLIKKLPQKIKFSILARIDCIDEEVCRQLRLAGLTYIFVGIDSVVEEDLKLFNKGYTAQKVYYGLDKLLNAGFSMDVDSEYRIAVGYITWHPYTTLKGLRESYNFFIKYYNTPKLIEHNLLLFKSTPLMNKVLNDKLLVSSNEEKNIVNSWVFSDKNIEKLYNFTMEYFNKWSYIRDGIRLIEKYVSYEASTLKNCISGIVNTRILLDKHFYEFFGSILDCAEKNNYNEAQLIKDKYINDLDNIISNTTMNEIDFLCKENGIVNGLDELLKDQSWLCRYRN